DQEVTLVAVFAREVRVEVAARDDDRRGDERRAEAGDDAAGDQHALAVARVLILGAPSRLRRTQGAGGREVGFVGAGVDLFGLGELLGFGLFDLERFFAVLTLGATDFELFALVTLGFGAPDLELFALATLGFGAAD